MTKDRFFYNDLAGSTAFTVTATETIGFGKENAYEDNLPGNLWQSDGTGTQYFTFTGTGPENIKGCYLINTNLVTGDTVEIEASDDGFSTIEQTQALTLTESTYDTFDDLNNRLLSVTNNNWYAHFDWTYRDYRVKFLTSNPIDGYQAGRILLFAGDYTVDKNHDGASYQAGATIVNDVIPGMYGRTEKIFNHRKLFHELPYRSIKGSQVRELQKIQLCKPVVLWIDGLESNRLAYGKAEFGNIENRLEFQSEKYYNDTLGMFEEYI